MDYRTDNNPRGLNFILDCLGDRAPDYLRNEKQASEGEPTRFAHREAEEFPYSNEAETWRSYAYLKTASNNAGLEPATHRLVGHVLKLAAARFDIEQDLCEIDMIITQSREQDPDAMEKFALVVERDKKQHNLYPIDNHNRVRESAVKLANDLDLPIEWRRQASTKIVKAAEVCGVGRDELPASVVRLGAAREPNFKHAAEIAQGRGEHFGDTELGHLYSEIVKSAEADTEDQLDNYVDLMIDLDRSQGLKSYPPGLTDPYSAFYSGIETAVVEKAASENVFLADTMIPTEAFRNTSEYVNTFFSKRAADNILGIVEKHGSNGLAMSVELGKLPLNTQRDLARLCVKHG